MNRETSALAAIAWLAAGCFVNEGDCEANGVSIDPCAVPARIGQTRQMTAEVTDDPGQDVTWAIPNAAFEAFDISFEGNTMQLIGKLGIAGAYRFRAESAVDSSQFGEAVVTVGVPSFGFPPPPIQIQGGDFPADYQAAVAAGGDRYYVAYADLVDVAARGGGSQVVVGFVRQFEAGSNRPLAEVTDAFTFFDRGLAVPNVAADAGGNAYWIDFIRSLQAGDFIHPEIRRLARNGTQPESQDLRDFCDAGPLAVAPDGTLYFFGQNFDTDCEGRELFRILAFGTPPEVVTIDSVPFAGETYDTLAVDSEGRLLLADETPDGNDAILRILPERTQTTLMVDASFELESADSFGIRALAVDAFGVVYGVAPAQFDPLCDDDEDPESAGLAPHGLRDSVVLVDSLGRFVRERVGMEDLPVRIECYEYQCPEGCTDPRCGQPIPFESIRSIAATPDGRLRIVDDVTVGLPDDDPCQVTVRIVLIDP